VIASLIYIIWQGWGAYFILLLYGIIWTTVVSTLVAVFLNK